MNRFVDSITTLSVVTVLAVMTGGCEAQKSENPLSPSVAGPIPGVDITAPRLLEPAQGFKFKENQQPIKLVIENSNTTGVRPITYIFEVAADSGFATKVFARSGVAPGEGGAPACRSTRSSSAVRTYWRARAEDGANNSLFSTAEFSVLPRAVLTMPTPASPVNSETPADAAGRRCASTTRTRTRPSAPSATSSSSRRTRRSRSSSATGLVAEGGADAVYGRPRLDYSTTHYWRVYASDGETTTEWSPTAVFRTPPRQAVAGAAAGRWRWRRQHHGCANGVLADPETWFFRLIGRTKGSDASDWYSVLFRDGDSRRSRSLAEAGAERIAPRHHAAVRRRRSARPVVPADGNARRPRLLHTARRYPRGHRRRTTDVDLERVGRPGLCAARLPIV